MSMVQPILGMIGVTSGVWSYMYAVRLHHIQKNNINPQDMRTPELLEQTLPERVMNPANNFKNLFEIPVLFYVLCVVIELEKLSELSCFGISLYEMAWGYVILRLLHSIVQCTYNTVMHRFTVYILSCIILFTMLTCLLWHL